MINSLVLAMLLMSGPGSGETPDPFAPIRFLVGSWQGSGNGPGGPSTVTHTVEPVLAGKFLRWQTHTVFAPKKDGTAGDVHDDVGFFSYDPARKKIVFRQFHSEGFVNTYVVEMDEKPDRITMVSEQVEGAGGAKARMTITILDSGNYHSSLDLAPPGKDFSAQQTQVMVKLDPKNWLKGLDVSHFSGDIDWQKLRSEGHRFAFVKATEGNDWVDPTLLSNMDNIKKAGMIRGAYHFFVGHDDPEPQAQNFIANVKLEKGDLPPVVDIETLSNRPVEDLAARLKTFIAIVEKHYGIKPIIYTSPNFWDRQIQEPFAGYHLWVAEYGDELPRIPNGWQVWSFWQFEENVVPPGVAKMADLNYFNGTSEELAKLLIP